MLCVLGAASEKTVIHDPTDIPLRKLGPHLSLLIRLSLLHKMPSSSFIYPSSYELLHLLQSKRTSPSSPLSHSSHSGVPSWWTARVRRWPWPQFPAMGSTPLWRGYETTSQQWNVGQIQTTVSSNIIYHISKPITKEKMIHARVCGIFLFFLNWSMVRRLEWNTVRIGEMVSLTSNHSP